MKSSATTIFRPPAEAHSILLHVAEGCPHNKCAFCALYRQVTYREYDQVTLARRIAKAAEQFPERRRIFLTDGDALALPMQTLTFILETLRHTLPRLTRVNCYASGQSLASKSDAELTILRSLGLHTLYMGLESGSEEALRAMNKNCTAAVMIDGCKRAQNLGLSMSVIILIGMGGQKLSAAHATDTAAALNAMQPRLLSCLRLVPLPGTPLAEWTKAKRFHQLTEEGVIKELHDLLAKLKLTNTVFRADHASNILFLSGRLPKHKDTLLQELESLLQCGILNKTGPGNMPALL